MELPEDLAKRGIHPRFHASLLRRHEPNDSELFPHRETRVFYDLGADPDEEFLVEEILDHEWHGNKVLFKVKWSLGDETLEPFDTVKDLEALDRYFEIYGVEDWRSLPKPRIPRKPSKRKSRR